MSATSKQDRQGVRTASDIERKYQFNKSFSEVMGIAKDAQSSADAASRAVYNLDESMDQDEIFNRLTVNGTVQGIYKVGGEIYVNASFIQSGLLLADLIKAGILSSKDGETFYLDLENGVLKAKFDELTISGKNAVTEEDLEDYAQSVTDSLNHIQNQIDGQIYSWFYDYIPTTSNYPASEWTTDALKNEHVGDLFYVVDNEESGGLTYRWVYTNGTYSWVIVEDTDVAKALAAAAQAQDTADGKRRVFVAQPYPPYDVGDLWTDGADLKVCQTARASGSYYASDWKLATDYIDSEKAGEIAQNKVDAQTQTDIFNKLTNNGALQGLFMQGGDMYMNATYIKSGILLANLIKAGVLSSNDGKTFYLDLDNGPLKADFDELAILGKSAATEEKAGTIAQGKVDAQTQAFVFNKLTNSGALKGLYMQNGDLYINASYLKSGTISADLIDVANLIAQKLKSTSGSSILSVDGAALNYTCNNLQTILLNNGSDGLPILYMYDRATSKAHTSQLSPHHLQLGGTSLSPVFSVNCLNGYPALTYGEIEGAMFADHIVESSFGINFSYIKYASGYAEGWGQAQFEGVPITTAFGSLYESAAKTITFPSAVDGSPYWCNLSVLDASLGVMLEVRGSVTATTSQTFFLVRGKSTASVDATIGYRVAWNWK